RPPPRRCRIRSAPAPADHRTRGPARPGRLDRPGRTGRFARTGRPGLHDRPAARADLPAPRPPVQPARRTAADLRRRLRRPAPATAGRAAAAALPLRPRGAPARRTGPAALAAPHARRTRPGGAPDAHPGAPGAGDRPGAPSWRRGPARGRGRPPAAPPHARLPRRARLRRPAGHRARPARRRPAAAAARLRRDPVPVPDSSTGPVGPPARTGPPTATGRWVRDQHEGAPRSPKRTFPGVLFFRGAGDRIRATDGAAKRPPPITECT